MSNGSDGVLMAGAPATLSSVVKKDQKQWALDVELAFRAALYHTECRFREG